MMRQNFPKSELQSCTEPAHKSRLEMTFQNPEFETPHSRNRASKFPIPGRAARWNLRGQVRHGISGRPRRRGRRRGSFWRSRSRPRGERAAGNATLEFRSPFHRACLPTISSAVPFLSYTIGFTNKSSISVFFGVLMSSLNRLGAPKFRPFLPSKFLYAQNPLC